MALWWHMHGLLIPVDNWDPDHCHKLFKPILYIYSLFTISSNPSHTTSVLRTRISFTFASIDSFCYCVPFLFTRWLLCLNYDLSSRSSTIRFLLGSPWRSFVIVHLAVGAWAFLNRLWWWFSFCFCFSLACSRPVWSCTSRSGWFIIGIVATGTWSWGWLDFRFRTLWCFDVICCRLSTIWKLFAQPSFWRAWFIRCI